MSSVILRGSDQGTANKVVRGLESEGEAPALQRSLGLVAGVRAGRVSAICLVAFVMACSSGAEESGAGAINSSSGSGGSGEVNDAEPDESDEFNECAEGEWREAEDAGGECRVWTTCKPGEYAASEGTDTSNWDCVTCPAGSHCEGGADEPSACPAGFTCGGAEAEPESCAVGEHCPSGSTEATACAPGTWDHDADAATACVQHSTCEPGEKLAADGTALADQSCVACDAFTFSSTENASSCMPWSNCAVGQYVSNESGEGPDASHDRTCTSCAEGFYSANENSGVCVEDGSCAAGTYKTKDATDTPLCQERCRVNDLRSAGARRPWRS